MIRCKTCLNRVNVQEEPCPVCGIAADKPRKELAPAEKKVRFHARCIRVAAMFHLIGAFITLLIHFIFPLPAVATATLTLINITLAFGLAHFAFWAYRAATVYYFLLGMVNLVSVQIPALLLVLILLYIVGNSTSKALFERQVLPYKS